jgi:tyrosyl-tRNA synthetase
VQLGGADQWANIINGVELARRQDGRQLFGLTMPLLTTSDGRKMGKSAQGAIWLNPQRLSPFDFWQFWRNCDDRDVGRFLALFTELPLAEITQLAQAEGAQLNAAKVRLASAVTALVHGEEAAQLAEATAQGLFAQGDELQGLTTLSVRRSQLAAGYSLTELLEQHDLQPSRGATRRLAAGGGLRLDGSAVVDADLTLPADRDDWLLSLGKKRHYRIQLED